MKKIKVYKAILVLLIIAAVIVAVFVVRKFYKSNQTENKAKSVVEEIKENLNTQNESEAQIDAELGGYKVIGIIKIPKINLEYPILEKTNTESLNISITKFWGNEINEIGNVTLAGQDRKSVV